MKLSIVTPSFNQAPYLEKTLQSVIKQKTADVEYIVVDGGSTDGCREILERYESSISRLIIEPDEGQADAIRKGFALATGEVLCFLNSDDLLAPGAVEFVLSYFKSHKGVDALYSNRIFVDESSRIMRFWILPPHSDYCMSRWDFIPQETCFWRRSLMDQAGPLDPTYQFALDYDLFARMMKVGTFRRVNKFLAAFRWHSESKTNTVYETVGRREIARVRSAQDITANWFDPLLRYLFGGGIIGVSMVYKVVALAALRKRISFD